MKKKVRLAALFTAAVTSAAITAPAMAQSTRTIDVFAKLEAPGHPTGVLVDGGRVVVSTSAGNPFHANTSGERIHTFDRAGRLRKTLSVDEGPVSNMGLGAMAVDAQGRLYVADMNGLVRRFSPDGSSDIWASSPLPYSAGSWATSMWNSFVFDAAGNAYVIDGGSPGRIWKVTPTGELSLWFTDERMATVAGGPWGGQIDAAGEFLYFVQVLSFYPDRFTAGSVYRLPLKDNPEAADLEEIHRFSSGPEEVAGFARNPPYTGAEPNGIAIGKSGRLYVTVGSRNEIAVLDPEGKLLETIASPLFSYPVGITFLGNKLLVANMDIHAGIGHPEHWTVLTVDVDDTGIAPFVPRNIP